MTYYDDTVKISAVDVLQATPNALVLPANVTTMPQQHAMPAPVQTQKTALYEQHLAGFALSQEQEQEFRLAMIWIFLSIVVCVAAIIALFLIVQIQLP